MASDLTKSQKAVQAAHAAAEWCQTIKGQWYNGTMVILEVEEPVKWRQYLRQRDLMPITFREPDLGWRVTALAVCVPKKDRQMFKHVKLC